MSANIMDWKGYEKEIYDHFVTQYPSAKITHNAKILGKYSKVERQIDILIEDQASNFAFRIVIDAKHHNKPIDVNEVEAFLGFLRDVDAHMGILISPEGFSQAAVNRAHYDDMDIMLDILNFKDLKQFQGFGAILYAAKYGVLLPAPLGWIIDAQRSEGRLANLYQRGLSFEGAAKSREFMYVNIWKKDGNVFDIATLRKFQETPIMKSHDARIEDVLAVQRKHERTAIRAIRASDYPATEFTGFVEFKDFIFFCVLFTPPELEKKNLAKLNYILQRVLPLNINRS